jgi:hypothetical protein
VLLGCAASALHFVLTTQTPSRLNLVCCAALFFVCLSAAALAGRRGASAYTTPLLLSAPGSLTLTLRCVLPSAGTGGLGTLEYFHEVLLFACL